MIRSVSIPVQLALLFGLSLIATLGTGGFGYFAIQRVSLDVAKAEERHVPAAQQAAETANILGQLELTALVYLNQEQYNASVETRIAQLMADLDASRTATEQDSSLTDLADRMTKALTAHADAARFTVQIDGRVKSAADLLEMVLTEQAAYLEYIDKKARYGEKRGLIEQPQQTRFAQWAAKFDPPDPDLAALVADVSAQEADIVTRVAADFAAGGKVSELLATRLQGAPRIKLTRAMTLLQRGITNQTALARKARADAVSMLQLSLQRLNDTARADHAQALDALSATVFDAGGAGRFASLGISLAIALSVVIALSASLFAWRRIGAPLAQLSRVIARLAERDYRVDVPFRNRGDEIGTIAQSADTFRLAGLDRQKALRLAEEKRSKDQKEAVAALATGLNQLAGGDLACHVDQRLSPEYEPLRQDFNTAVAALSDAILQISLSSGVMNGSVTELAKASADLSHRTEQSAASLVQTSTTLRQLSDLIENASRGAVEANEISQSAKTHAEDSSSVLTETVKAMRDLENSSGQITKIVGMVDDIAFQTNLLAINAGVEAARAGNAGLGFSVVASEVRALAQRSSDAAQEIGGLISTSGAQISKGVALVDRVGEALAAITQSVDKVSARVSTIATSSQEQAAGIGEISDAVAQLEQATQNNASMFQHTTSSTRSLANEAKLLAEASDKFRLPQASPQPKAATPDPARTAA